jgi:hypothetical protein
MGKLGCQGASLASSDGTTLDAGVINSRKTKKKSERGGKRERERESLYFTYFIFYIQNSDLRNSSLSLSLSLSLFLCLDSRLHAASGMKGGEFYVTRIMVDLTLFYG